MYLFCLYCKLIVNPLSNQIAPCVKIFLKQFGAHRGVNNNKKNLLPRTISPTTRTTDETSSGTRSRTTTNTPYEQPNQAAMIEILGAIDELKKTLKEEIVVQLVHFV